MPDRATISRLAWPAVAMALGAALFFTLGFGAAHRGSGQTLRLPLDGRWVQSPPFRPSPGGSYRASLQLDRRHPHREMKCLADVGTPSAASSENGRHSDCPPGFEPIQVEWVLVRDGRPISASYAFGPHAGEYGGDFVGRSFGTYRLYSGAQYRLGARIVAAPRSAAVTRPRIVLAYDQMTDLIFMTLLWSVAALLLAGWGAWRLVRSFLSPPGERKGLRSHG